MSTVLVPARREFLTNVELCLLSPILPIVAAVERQERVGTVLALAAVQLGCLGAGLLWAWTSGQSTGAWSLIAAGAGVGAFSGAVVIGGAVGPLAFGLSRVSVVSLGCCSPLALAYLSDAWVAAMAAVILLANALFSVWPADRAQHRAAARGGPLPPRDQAVRLRPGHVRAGRAVEPRNHPAHLHHHRGRAAGAYNCEPVHASALSLHGPHAATTAHYMTLGALFLYIAACQRQYAPTWRGPNILPLQEGESRGANDDPNPGKLQPPALLGARHGCIAYKNIKASLRSAADSPPATQRLEVSRLWFS